MYYSLEKFILREKSYFNVLNMCNKNYKKSTSWPLSKVYACVKKYDIKNR